MMVTGARPDLNLGRGGGGFRQKKMSRPAIARKYLVMREAALRKTHQAPLNDYIQTNGEDFKNAGAAVKAYFDFYRDATEAAMARYDRQIKALENDKLLDSVRRADAISKLASPTRPSWSAEQEAGFITTYADPRADMRAWNAMIEERGLEVVDTFRNGENVEYERTNWEIQVPTMLEHPDWDGSVSPVRRMNKQPKGGQVASREERIRLDSASVEIVDEDTQTDDEGVEAEALEPVAAE